MIVTEQVRQQNQQADTRQISWSRRAQTEGRACQKTSGKTADAPECLERRHNRSSIRLLNDNSLGVDSNVDTAFGPAEQESRDNKQDHSAPVRLRRGTTQGKQC